MVYLTRFSLSLSFIVNVYILSKKSALEERKGVKNSCHVIYIGLIDRR